MPFHGLSTSVSTYLNFVAFFPQKACLFGELYMQSEYGHLETEHLLDIPRAKLDMPVIFLEIKKKFHPMNCSVLCNSLFRKKILIDNTSDT